MLAAGGNAVDAAVATGIRARRHLSGGGQHRRRRVHGDPPARWPGDDDRLPRDGARARRRRRCSSISRAPTRRRSITKPRVGGRARHGGGIRARAGEVRPHAWACSSLPRCALAARRLRRAARACAIAQRRVAQELRAVSGERRGVLTRRDAVRRGRHAPAARPRAHARPHPRRGRDGFYKGETARLIARGDAARRRADHAKRTSPRYEAKERAPVRGTYRGYEIISMPPPSSGGVALIEMLNILEGFDLASGGAQLAALRAPGRRGDAARVPRPRAHARRSRLHEAAGRRG